ACTWSGPGFGPAPRIYASRDFPWITSQLLREQPVGFSRADELPPEAVHDAETFRRRGVRSNLAIPMVAGGRVLGSLAFVTLTVERAWTDELVQPLRLVREVFAKALPHQEADDAVRAGERINAGVLA